MLSQHRKFVRYFSTEPSLSYTKCGHILHGTPGTSNKIKINKVDYIKQTNKQRAMHSKIYPTE